MALPIQGKGAWVWYARSCGTVEDILFWCQQGGIDHLLIKVGDGPRFGDRSNPDVFRQQFLAVRDPLKAAGLRVLTWSYNYLEHPQAEAEIANWSLANGSDGHVFDVEVEAKGKPEAAEDLGRQVRAVHPGAFLAYASLPVISRHRDLPYLQFNRFCDAVMPQFYIRSLGTGEDYPFSRLFAEWDEWTARWAADGEPVPVLAPTIDGYVPGNEQTIREYGPLAQARNIPGVCVYRLDTMSPAMYVALRDLTLDPPEEQRAVNATRLPVDAAWRTYRKVVSVQALRMDKPFVVETADRALSGAAGDYLVDADGDRYPVSASVFEATYQPE